MTRVETVVAVIKLIKANRANWRVSHRAKNFSTTVTLGLDFDALLDEIYQRISWRDYVSGPMVDQHLPVIPGEIWVFGLLLEGEWCYLKFQLKKNNAVFWISIHPAEYPLVFPFKS